MDEREKLPNTTSSATDCTGLIPALPEDDPQEDAYEALYPTHRPRRPKGGLGRSDARSGS